ncbi:MAG: hypothetical protein OEZ02_01095 [Anaerolineae bacterium]|nr:hypothetical protein [Anaerolineae bacterium]
MIRIFYGVFLVLHGLVHLLYLGQSARYFELQPGMVWPDGAWAFSKLLGNETTRMVANILLALAALVFVGGGVGFLGKQEWWRCAVLSAAAFSTVIYFLLWDGRFENLANNGWVGILINLIVLGALIWFKWPKI